MRSATGARSATKSCSNSSAPDLASAGIADRYQYELYLRQGMEQLRQFFEAARSAPPPEVIETERGFELQVGPAKLTGRVDRIDRTGPDTVAIVDYKTGKAKSQEDADESLQLSLYALAARETWGKRADRLIFHNLEDNTPVFTTRTDAELEAAKLRVREAADGIAQGEFREARVSLRVLSLSQSVSRDREDGCGVAEEAASSIN